MLVDHQNVTRAGLALLIDQPTDLLVVGQAASVREAQLSSANPDVVVVDVDMPHALPDEVLRDLRERFTQTSILVLTLVAHPAKVQSILAAGVDGYLLKTAPASNLLNAIRTVAAGDTYLQPSLGVELARWHRDESARPDLSATEETVLRLLALGHTSAEVASLCGVSTRTVETHRSRLSQKLGCRTRVELVAYALRAGLLTAEPQRFTNVTGFSQAELGGVLAGLQKTPTHGRRPEELTPREVDVLTCLMEGLSNRLAGERLGLSANTIRNHVQRILWKLNAHSKLEAVVVARRDGLVDGNR
jgi:two-component system, NarL family, response regulator NreC